MKYVFIPRPYDNQETMHEKGSGGLHSGGSLKQEGSLKLQSLARLASSSMSNYLINWFLYMSYRFMHMLELGGVGG